MVSEEALQIVEERSQDVPGGPVVKNVPSNAGDLGLIADWGTKIPQDAHLRWPLSQCLQLLNPHATNKTQCSQINKY